MSIAAKHLDPVIGIDVHIILIPTPAGPVPTPLPNPFVGIVMDPFDYAPYIGATVKINGLPRAQAGTGVVNIPHLPLGGPLGPPPPGNEGEVFMGSSTVASDGDAQSYFALPVLSCQSIGMPAVPRLKGKPPKSLVLPTSIVLSVPMGMPVFVGGPPIVSLMALGFRAAFALLGPLGRAIRGAQRGAGRVGRAARAISARARRAGNALADALGLGATARNRINRAICTVTGHPVDVATGKVFTEHVDFELPGVLGLRWERVWYSTSAYHGPLGHGWHGSYDAALYVSAEVVLHRSTDGRLLSFPPLTVGQSHFDRAEGLTLLRDEAGYALRTRTGVVYRFQDIGRPNAEHVLTSIMDRAGNSQQLRYDDRRRLVEILDEAQRSIRLEYDTSERVAQLTAPHPNGLGRFCVVQYSYDEQGNLGTVTDALGHPASYRYRDHLLSTETDRNGFSFHFSYSGTGTDARCVRTWGDGGVYDHELGYDVERGVTQVTDSCGARTTYEHAAGLVVRTVDALDAVTTCQYDAWQHKTAHIDALGRTKRWSYDERGNVVAVEGPDGASIRLEYDEHDQLVGETDAIGGKWLLCYDDAGRLTQRRNPLGQGTDFQYAGRSLVAVTDPAHHASDLEPDEQGNVRALRGPTGSERSFRYDALGRLIARTDELGNTQRRTYDLLSRLVRIDEPDGTTREYSYDREGHLLTARWPGHELTYRYCGFGRLAARTHADTTLHFEYDSEERLLRVVNEHGHVYSFELGPTGAIAVETGFDGGRRSYERDLLGRVVQITRPSGARVKLRYDAADRIVAVDYGGDHVEHYSYRADGELISASNDACVVRLARDALGRVVRESQGHDWVASEYDPIGRRTRMGSSLGAAQQTQFDKQGDLLALEHTQAGASAFSVRFVRDALGLEIERSLPGGVRGRWWRNHLGLPAEHVFDINEHSLHAVSYRWLPDARLQTLIDVRTGARQYEHDARGRLVATRAAARSELRVADAVGNLYRRPDRTDRNYGPAGQLREARDESNRLVRYQYDDDGNLIEKRTPDGQRWRYRWSPAGLLSEVERPDGDRVRFAYDALGRRVAKSFRGQTTRWVWDDSLPLHEWVEDDVAPLDVLRHGPRPANENARAPQSEHERAREAALADQLSCSRALRGERETPITWLFEPETFAPLAKGCAGHWSSIVTDHLGTPNTVIDEAGRVTWSARVDAWGQLQDVDGPRAACPFRWPGQYEDLETGLHYNRFRYYDPEAGQYVSQDPLRLAGGLAAYGYVSQPELTCDPLGLAFARPFSMTETREVLDQSDGRVSPTSGQAGHPRRDHVRQTDADLLARTHPTPPQHPVGRASSFQSNASQNRATMAALNSAEGQAALAQLDANPGLNRVTITAPTPRERVRVSTSTSGNVRTVASTETRIIVDRIPGPGDQIHVQTCFAR